MDSILEDLLLAAGACRVTLRQDLPGEYAFPVTHEALAPGVPSLVDERTVDLRTQPVVRELMRGHQVVQPDCRAAFDDFRTVTGITTLEGITPERVELFGHRLSCLVGGSFFPAARFGQAWRSAAFAR